MAQAAKADLLEWLADEGLHVFGRVVPSRGKPAIHKMVMKDPVGPVAAFTSWNFPIKQVVRKVGPAHAVGCSMIGKAACVKSEPVRSLARFSLELCILRVSHSNQVKARLTEAMNCLR